MNINKLIVDEELPGWDLTGDYVRTRRVSEFVRDNDDLWGKVSVGDMFMIADLKGFFDDRIIEREIITDEMIKKGDECGSISFIQAALAATPEIIKEQSDRDTYEEICRFKLNLQTLLQSAECPPIYEQVSEISDLLYTERSTRENSKIGSLFHYFERSPSELVSLFNKILSKLTLHDFVRLLVIKRIIGTCSYKEILEKLQPEYKSRGDIVKSVLRGINANSIRLINVIELIRKENWPKIDVNVFQLEKIKSQWFENNNFIYDYLSSILNKEVLTTHVCVGYLIDTTSILNLISLVDRIIKEISVFDLIDLAYQSGLFYIEIDPFSLTSDDEYKWGIQLQQQAALRFALQYKKTAKFITLGFELRKLLQPLVDYDYENKNIEVDEEPVSKIGYIYGQFFAGREEALINLLRDLFKELSLYDVFRLALKKDFVSANPEIIATAGDPAIYDERGVQAKRVKLIDMIDVLKKKYSPASNTLFDLSEKIKSSSHNGSLLDEFKDELMTDVELRQQGIYRFSRGVKDGTTF